MRKYIIKHRVRVKRKKKILWVIGSAKFRCRGLQSPCGLSVFVSYSHTHLCILNTQLLLKKKKKRMWRNSSWVLYWITSKTEVCNSFSCTSCTTDLLPLYCHLWLKHTIASYLQSCPFYLGTDNALSVWASKHIDTGRFIYLVLHKEVGLCKVYNCSHKL